MLTGWSSSKDYSLTYVDNFSKGSEADRFQIRVHANSVAMLLYDIWVRSPGRTEAANALLEDCRHPSPSPSPLAQKMASYTRDSSSIVALLENESSGKLDTRLHFKQTNKFQYLLFNSAHPRSVLKGLVKGELTRALTTIMAWVNGGGGGGFTLTEENGTNINHQNHISNTTMFYCDNLLLIENGADTKHENSHCKCIEIAKLLIENSAKIC